MLHPINCWLVIALLGDSYTIVHIGYAIIQFLEEIIVHRWLTNFTGGANYTFCLISSPASMNEARG